jgi:hypothetical protein
MLVAALAAFCLLAAQPLSAHHSFSSEFDVNRPLTLRGTVTKWELINPHSWLHIDVKGADGQVVRWMVEGGSPNALLRLGYRKDSIVAGTEIIVHGYQARDGANRAVGRDLTLPDGKRLLLGGSTPQGR